MAKTTSNSILGVISWILDHFEIFVNMLGGGLRSSSAFLVSEFDGICYFRL